LRLKYRPRHIAPRLANGDPRVAFGHGLPQEVKDALREIAYKANKSMSWVAEECLIEYFGLRRPEYVAPKPEKEKEKPAKSEPVKIVQKPKPTQELTQHG